MNAWISRRFRLRPSIQAFEVWHVRAVRPLHIIAIGVVFALLTVGAVAWFRSRARTDIDQRIQTLRLGASMMDVVETLGPPNGRMWQKRPDIGEMIWIYEGRHAYSIRIRRTRVAEIASGRLGGPTDPEFNHPVYEVLADER